MIINDEQLKLIVKFLQKKSSGQKPCVCVCVCVCVEVAGSILGTINILSKN